MEECKIRQDIYRDARPSDLCESVLRLTCVAHGVVADSDAWVGMGAVAALRQASERLRDGHR